MNLQEAANRAGVHYQTAYRWVREGRLRATKSAAEYDISEGEILRFLEDRRRPVAPPERIQVRRWNQLQERFREHAVAGDELEAWAVVERLHTGQVSNLDVCENLFGPVLSWIGNEWHCGRLSIAHEHRAAAIIERAISRLTSYPRGRPRGTVVITTPTGEVHRLPSIMASLVLRDDRWRVHHLGADLPVLEILQIVKEATADVLVVSVTYSRPAAVDELADAAGSLGIAVLVGRPGSTLTNLVTDARRVSPAMAR